MRLDTSAGITSIAVLNKMRKKFSKRYQQELEGKVENLHPEMGLERVQPEVESLPAAMDGLEPAITAADRFAALRATYTSADGSGPVETHNMVQVLKFLGKAKHAAVRSGRLKRATGSSPRLNLAGSPRSLCSPELNLDSGDTSPNALHRDPSSPQSPTAYAPDATSATMGAQITATLNRLEEADECDDANQIFISLHTGRELLEQKLGDSPEADERWQQVRELEGGEEQVAKIRKMLKKLTARMEGDEALQLALKLKEDKAIKRKLRRLWDLLTVQSEGMDGIGVALNIYQGFHTRLAIVISERESVGSMGGSREKDGKFVLGKAAIQRAMEDALEDFKEDIERYGECLTHPCTQ